MSQHIFDLLRGYLTKYGYGAVAATLLFENLGLPVPGETILLLASFLAYSQHHLQLGYIILVGICATTLGGDLGFLIGLYGGRTLLERYRKTLNIQPLAIARGEALFQRYGSAAIFLARFVAGLRVIAGPLAGVLSMPWQRFVFFNFLGAALWVTVVSSAGYFFGKHWEELFKILRGVNIALLLAAVVVVMLLLWLRQRRSSPRHS